MKGPTSPRIAFALLAAIVALAGGCGKPSRGSSPEVEEKPKEQAIDVRVAPATRAPVSAFYASSATLRPEKQAVVGARARGVIRRLHVEEGDVVVQGQTMALLEDDEQRIALAKAKAAAETKKREHERAERLLQQKLLSDEGYEAARREATDAHHAVEESELALSRTVIRAPFAGSVMRRHLDVGATVSDGTPVYDLADLDPLLAEVNVPERHVARLAPGQPVRLTADASDTVVDGRIERIAPGVNPATGTVKVTVSSALGPGLRSGSFVRVAVVTETRDDALVVPRSALVADGRLWILYALGEDRTTVKRLHVGVGLEQAELVEITSTDGGVAPVEAGDEVVVIGAPALSDGARVRVLDAQGVAPGAAGDRT